MNKNGVTFPAEYLKSDEIRNVLAGVKKDMDFGMPPGAGWPGEVIAAKELLAKIDATTTPTIDLTFTEFGFLLVVSGDSTLEISSHLVK